MNETKEVTVSERLERIETVLHDIRQALQPQAAIYAATELFADAVVRHTNRGAEGTTDGALSAEETKRISEALSVSKDVLLSHPSELRPVDVSAPPQSE